jgi:hypothetical protein
VTQQHSGVMGIHSDDKERDRNANTQAAAFHYTSLMMDKTFWKAIQGSKVTNILRGTQKINILL